MRSAVRLTVLAGVVALLAAAPGAQSKAGEFSLVIERDGRKWSVDCASGCSLKRVSVSTRDEGMPLRLDNRGLRTIISPQPADTTFAFTLTPKGNGFTAEAVHGTMWTSLSMNCDFSPCRATVTQSGVFGAGSGR